jgi:hypothetical protein
MDVVGQCADKAAASFQYATYLNISFTILQRNRFFPKDKVQMAEVFATVVSGAGLASLGLQLVDCAVKLKAFYETVEKAPKSLNRISRESKPSLCYYGKSTTPELSMASTIRRCSRRASRSAPSPRTRLSNSLLVCRR